MNIRTEQHPEASAYVLTYAKEDFQFSRPTPGPQYQRNTNSQDLESWGEIKEMLGQSQTALLEFQAAKEERVKVIFTNYKEGEQGMTSTKLMIWFCLKSYRRGKLQFK